MSNTDATARDRRAQEAATYERYWEEMPCYLSVHDRDFTITEANRRFREDFGERIGLDIDIAAPRQLETATFALG